jgi:WD40 repeat protein
VTSGKLIRTLRNHTSDILYSLDAMNGTNGEKVLVSGSWDRAINVWNWATGEIMRTIKTDSDIWSLAVVKLNHIG